MKKIILGVFLSLFFTACTTSPDLQATNTPVPSTATIQPSPTEVPTSTPIPYDLTVSVTTSEDEPIPNAILSIADLGESMHTDDLGQANWSGMTESDVDLSAFAQGYLPVNLTETLERGSNLIEINLEQDPNGLYAPDLLKEGQSILYIEDFQDQNEDFFNISGNWQIVEDSDVPGNYVFEFNQTENDDIAFADIGIAPIDFIAEYRFRFIDLNPSSEGNWASINFRVYAWEALVMPDWKTVELLYFNPDGWEFPIQIQRNIQSNVWYEMRVEAIGSEINVFINGSQMGRIQDAIRVYEIPGKSEQGIAFLVSSGTKVQYDDLVIIDPGQ